MEALSIASPTAMIVMSAGWLQQTPVCRSMLLTVRWTSETAWLALQKDWSSTAVAAGESWPCILAGVAAKAVQATYVYGDTDGT